MTDRATEVLAADRRQQMDTNKFNAVRHLRKHKQPNSWVDRVPVWVWLVIPLLFAGFGIAITLFFFMDIDWTLIIASVIGDRNAVLRTRAAEKALILAREQWAARGNPAAALWDLRKVVAGVGGYVAGLPRFPRIFARDSIKSALLLDNPKMLRAILELCRLFQGTKFDRATGEEPGKVFHELPGVALDIREVSSVCCALPVPVFCGRLPP